LFVSSPPILPHGPPSCLSSSHALSRTPKKARALGPGEIYQPWIESASGQKRLSSHDLVVEYDDVFSRRLRSGLELNYTEGQQELTVLKLFYEKLD